MGNKSSVQLVSDNSNSVAKVGSVSPQPCEITIPKKLINITSLMDKNGIFSNVKSFWQKGIQLKGSKTQSAINYSIINAIFEKCIGEKPDKDNTLDPIVAVATITQLCATQKWFKLTVFFKPYAQLCSTNGVTRPMLLSIWKEISSMLIERFGFEYTILMNYCCDVMVLFCIALVKWLADESEPLLESDITDIVDLLSLEFAKSAIDCLTHPYGSVYISRYIQNPNFNHSEILTIWNCYVKYQRCGDSSKHANRKEQLSSLIMDIYLSDKIFESGMISVQTYTKAKEAYQKGNRVLFSLLFWDTLKWFDSTHLSNFNDLLFKAEYKPSALSMFSDDE